jgi:GNAT superfamily N-acetyltransferase
MAVRPARPADILPVLQIAQDAFQGQDGPIGASWLCRRLADPGTRLVVDDAGVGLVRGFILLVRYAAGTRVRLVAVGQNYRRQGVGGRLLSVVRGPASAWVRSENAASRGLFSGAGWEEAIAPRRRKGDWAYYVRA